MVSRNTCKMEENLLISNVYLQIKMPKRDSSLDSEL